MLLICGYLAFASGLFPGVTLVLITTIDVSAVRNDEHTSSKGQVAAFARGHKQLNYMKQATILNNESSGKNRYGKNRPKFIN